MSSRQRVLMSLTHREPDRCATYTWINRPALRQLADHLGVEGQAGVEDCLGIDKWRTIQLPVQRPGTRDERIRQLIPREYTEMEGVSINRYGCVIKNHPDISYLAEEDYLYQPLQNASDASEVDQYPFDAPEIVAVDDKTRDDIRMLKEQDAVVTGSVQQPFKIACILRGMENVFCDLLLNEKIIDRIYDHLYAFNTAYCVALAEAQVDVVQIFGDIAMQDRLMMSPDLWRRFDIPRLAHLIGEVKRANPEALVYMHTDGKLTDIIPDLIEAGLDILNPIQPECQDPVEVKRKWGHRLVLHGTVSTQKTIPLGTPQDVKNEVNHLLEHCAAGGGLILGPANVLIPQFPVENVVAMYEAVSEFYS